MAVEGSGFWPTIADVEERFGRDLSPLEAARVTSLLADAVAAVKSYADGQHFERSTTTDRLRVRDGVVLLPQRPVSAVTAVTTSATPSAALSFTWDGGTQVAVSYHGAVNVTYTHGYESIPADIAAVIAQMAGRALGTTPTEAAVQSEGIGAYSYTLGPAAAAGALGMLPAERAILNRYRRLVRPIRMRT